MGFQSSAHIKLSFTIIGYIAAMDTKVIEMAIEPGAENLIKLLGRKMGTKARSKVIDRAVSHIRDDVHVSELLQWFSEDRFLPQRRSTVRVSPDNADWLAALADTVGKSRPLVLMGLVYFAAARIGAEDLAA